MIEAAAMLGGPVFETYIRSLFALIRVVETADAATSRLPLWRRARGALLDSLFGPAEDIEYVSRTAPANPPPTS